MTEQRPVRRWLVAALLAGSALAATSGAASGSALAGPTKAGQVLVSSRRAMAAVSVFTANGYILQGNGRLGFLIHSTDHGHAASGRFSSSSKAAFGYLGAYSFVRIGATFYLDGNARFWSSAVPSLPRAELARLRGRWIKLPGSEVRSIATITGSMTNPSRMAALIGADSPAASFAFGPRAVVRGHSAMSVRTASELVYLSAAPPHLPLEYVETTPESKTLVELGYPVSLKVVAPPVLVTAPR